NDACASMDAQWIEVLHVADGNAGIVGVPHYLVLNFFPADQGPLDQDLTNRTGSQAFAHNDFKLEGTSRHAAAGSAQGVGRSNNQRKADGSGVLLRRVHGVDSPAG